MGTRGNKVYRHKGRYYVYYNHWDSYPSGFGLQVLHEIPRNVSKEEFEEWVRKTREYVYAQRDSHVLNDPEDGSSYVSDKQPEENVLFIEWIYEIDLDNLVFHVDNQPLFRLDNMPPDDIFMKSISFDHFGHRALYEHTPTQFRYDWRAPPPTPSPESLVAYNSCHIRSSTSSVHDLLDIPVALSSIERVRTAFMQPVVTQCMTEDNVGHYARVLENVPDRDHIPRSMLNLALFLVESAVGPPVYSFDFWLLRPSRINRDFVWIRKDACLRITTHLDDEDNLKASIGDLVHRINTAPDKVGTVYGIACSIFHCAIVRVDKDLQGSSFAHTPALQFLPSFYARKMSTPGIEALSRLGCQSNGVEFLDVIPDSRYGYRNRQPTFTTDREFLVMPGSVAEKVPVEVWTRIGDFLRSPSDLVKLASISPQALSAAADLTRYPWVRVSRSRKCPTKESRLVDVVGSASPIPETTRKTKRSVIRQYHHQLGHAKFTAVVDGHRVTVNSVQYRRNHDNLKDEEEFEWLLISKLPPDFLSFYANYSDSE
ncbi:hypothetical protein F5888DRAFT_1722504 [Russula emetica]|nr:hypothetical protein F5888DRAFT_1722504 [Russula emetica]